MDLDNEGDTELDAELEADVERELDAEGEVELEREEEMEAEREEEIVIVIALYVVQNPFTYQYVPSLIISTLSPIAATPSANVSVSAPTTL